jgi:tetratricopeptide (TPR) repeat protein
VQATDNLYGFSFLTFGAGIEKAFDGFDAGLDYAFVPYGAVGPTHRFSLNLRLGAPEVKVASNSLDAGVDFMKQGQLDKALKVFQDAVEKDPNDTNARNLMGTCLFKMGRLDEAQKINEKPKVVESDIH